MQIHEPLQENFEAAAAMEVEDGTPLEIITLPMPGKIMREDQRLPASYANFYITNKVCAAADIRRP